MLLTPRKRQTKEKLKLLPQHNYPNWDWELQNLKVEDEMILKIECNIFGIYVAESQNIQNQKGLFAGKDFFKGNLFNQIK